MEVVYSPISFGGRTLSPTESRYTSPEKEVLAVFEGMRNFHYYTQDVTTHVFTDHAAMLNYANGVSINPRIVQWMTYLADYDIVCHHRKREFAHDSDGLTRLRWDNDEGTDIDEVVDRNEYDEDISTTRPNELYKFGILEAEDPLFDGIMKYLRGVSIEGFDADMRKKIRVHALKYFWFEGQLWRRSPWKPRLCVKALMRRDCIKKMHGGSEFGHMGVTTTFRLLPMRNYWPTMYADVKGLVGQCEVCQMYGKRPRVKYQLYCIPPQARFGLMIGMDFVNGLPGRYPNMLSFICKLMSWAESWPCTRTDAKFVIKCMEEWRHGYGTAETIITDNGSAFRSAEFGRYCVRIGADIHWASTHYAQTNGKVEKYQGSVTKLLAKEIKDTGDERKNWHNH